MALDEGPCSVGGFALPQVLAAGVGLKEWPNMAVSLRVCHRYPPTERSNTLRKSCSAVSVPGIAVPQC